MDCDRGVNHWEEILTAHPSGHRNFGCSPQSEDVFCMMWDVYVTYGMYSFSFDDVITGDLYGGFQRLNS